MHPLQKQFQDYIEKNNLLTSNDRILIAVSGGVDSMVLLGLLSSLKYSITVAHCNFGLRGENSDLDESLVKEVSKDLNIACHTKSFLVSGSIQLETRKLRYKWFSELVDEFGFTKICTAHHLDDSFETTLYNLTKGSGLKGLKGIPQINKEVLRPLLFASKSEILQYARDRNLEWREDASNAKTDYSRNKIRLEVVPKLKELNPSLMETFKLTKERLDLSSEFIFDTAQKIKSEYFQSSKSELFLKWINKPSDLLILSEILSEYGFNYMTSKEVFESIGIPGKIFPSNQFTVYMDRSSLFIKKNESSSEGQLLIDGAGNYQFGRYSFEVSIFSADGVEIDKNARFALLDQATVSFPLTIRKWEEGDSFVPLGMSGTKKVSDFLIDAKVPLPLKEEVLVVEDQNKIVWIVGMRISEDCKITQNTQELVRINILDRYE